MAFAKAKETALRHAYARAGLSLEAAAAAVHVSPSTARRWKKRALEQGDDWDAAKAASLLRGAGGERVARRTLLEYVALHNDLMDGIARDPEMAPEKKAAALANLAGALHRTVSASSRILPEIEELAVALRVLELLAEFTARAKPGLLAELRELLEPFGAELCRSFGHSRS